MVHNTYPTVVSLCSAARHTPDVWFRGCLLTPEERAARLAARAEREQRRRQTESAEARAARLHADAQRQRDRRQAESTEARAAR